MSGFADIVIKSEAVFTSTEDKPFAGAVAVTGDKITGVVHGEAPGEWIGEDTEVIECENKMVMPGLIDAHVHFFMGSAANSRYMNMEIEKSTSPEDCIRMMKEYEKANPDLPRLMGMGWFPANWGDCPLPTKEILDEAFPDKPVILYCADGHTTWCNTKGLASCDIDKDSVFDFGEACKGPDGELNGILLEGAAIKSNTQMSNFPYEILKEIYGDCFQSLAEKGITSISDITINTIGDAFLTLVGHLKELKDNGVFTARLNLYSNMNDGDYETEKEFDKSFGDDDLLRYAGIKSLIDGVTSTFTGLMLEPYTDKPDCMGDPANYPKEYYIDCITKANAAGYGVRLHCIGDRAVRWALDAFEASNKANDNPGNVKGIRNAVEHIETIHPDDIPRFKELGVMASMQPMHLPLDAEEKLRRVGPERDKWEWPHRSLLDAGARLCFGTDYPIVNFDPFANIYAAVARKYPTTHEPAGINPEQKVTLAEALKAYTIEGAYSYGTDDKVGTLEEGKYADIAILDCNLFDLEEDQLLDAKVERTFLGGKEVYNRK